MGTIGKIRLTRRTVLRKNCTEVMMWNFLQMNETGDLSYLVKSGPKPKPEILVERKIKINEEFDALRGESAMVTKYEMMCYAEELTLQVQYGSVLLHTLKSRVLTQLASLNTFEGLIAELESWGFYLDREKPIGKEIKRVENEIKALQTTITALNGEIYPEPDEKATDGSDDVVNFYTMLLTYSKILGQERINPKKTSLTEFVAMEKKVKELCKPKTKL